MQLCPMEGSSMTGAPAEIRCERHRHRAYAVIHVHFSSHLLSAEAFCGPLVVEIHWLLWSTEGFHPHAVVHSLCACVENM